MGPIARVSDRRTLDLDKLKGTLVDFNVLEHLLDDQRGVAAWQIELRKHHDDPLECDEVMLHVATDTKSNEPNLRDILTRRFHEVTELTPNAIVFHPVKELRDMLGVGRLLKEEKIADHRPKTTNGMPAPQSNPSPALSS
jgi:hypothetical protein